MSQIPDVNRELAEVAAMFAVFEVLGRDRERQRPGRPSLDYDCSMPLNGDQLLLLEIVSGFDGRANWHKVGRVALGRLSSPGRFANELEQLVVQGLLLESNVSGELWPTLTLTVEGLVALENCE